MDAILGWIHGLFLECSLNVRSFVGLLRRVFILVGDGIKGTRDDPTLHMQSHIVYMRHAFPSKRIV